jgi:hypothetical protein
VVRRDNGWSATSRRPIIASLPLIAARRQDGGSAPLVFDGATDAAAFQTYLEQVLVPTLRPGDIVVWDNGAAHKQNVMRQAVAAAGAVV